MSFEIKLSKAFKREFKQLAKRYRTLPEDLSELIDRLELDPEQGTPIGRSCYKVRLAIRSKARGKSGGARVITCVVAIHETVYLISIYDKSDQTTLTDQRLKALLDELYL